MNRISLLGKVLLAAMILVLFGQVSEAKEERGEGIGLTIYSSPGKAGQPYQQEWIAGRYIQVPRGFAIINEWRRLSLGYGPNTIRFQDVARLIDPSTVKFCSLTDEETQVLEQNYEYDLVSREKLLEKYIDMEIILEKEFEETGKIERRQAILVSTAGGIIVNMDEEIHLDPAGRIILPKLPGGLITRPTLVWLVDAKRSGEHLVTVSYETKGIAWNADYIAVIKEADKYLDLAGWVTIDNRSGATYKDAEIKLVAGDVHRAAPPGLRPGVMYEMAEAKEIGRGFVEKPFFEYHLYTLKRPSTLKDNSQKQLELFSPVSDVPCKKILLYYGNPGLYSFYPSPQTDRNLGTQSNKKVDIYLHFRNDERSKLAIPLPAGRVRVYKEDVGNSLEFIGEDTIDHTPKNEEVLLKLGSAFDIVGERKQTDFKVDYTKDWMEESFEIVLRNHKDEDVEVIVKENLFRWINWEITRKSHEYEKVDARTIHFKVKIPRNGEKKITYTVRYSW